MGSREGGGVVSAVESIVQTLCIGLVTIQAVIMVVMVLATAVEVFGVRFLARAAVLLPFLGAAVYGVGLGVQWIVS